ncbi:MAG: LLM class flavin-dependent oxidoreductase [Ilumatobacteraceae bacterium]
MSLSRLSLLLPPVGPWRDQLPGYRWAEEVGYDVVYTADHLTHPTVPGRWMGEAFTTLTAAATVTDRIRLGTLVASSVFRTPVSLARIAMTVQDVSGGRLVLGLGAGSPLCAEADQGARPPLSEMSKRYADVVRGYHAAIDGAVEWEGDVLSFGGLQTTARPDGTPTPELLLAGHGPRSLALAATYADTWNTYGGPGTAELDGDEFWAARRSPAGRLPRRLRPRGGETRTPSDGPPPRLQAGTPGRQSRQLPRGRRARRGVEGSTSWSSTGPWSDLGPGDRDPRTGARPTALTGTASPTGSGSHAGPSCTR